MGSESVTHEAEGHEGERNNCFSKIQLVGQKYRNKTVMTIMKTLIASSQRNRRQFTVQKELNK